MRRVLVAGIITLLGCGSTESTNPNDLIPQSYKVSECGGFEAPASAGDFAPTSYCDAEVLKWSFDSASGTLKLSDNRALLNCCGERKMSLTEQLDGSYEIMETDAPEAQTGSRCHCMCVFDLSMEATAIAAGSIQVQLKREVTDSGNGVESIWSGALDLTQGSGEVVIDSTDAGMWCGQP